MAGHPMFSGATSALKTYTTISMAINDDIIKVK